MDKDQVYQPMIIKVRAYIPSRKVMLDWHSIKQASLMEPSYMYSIITSNYESDDFIPMLFSGRHDQQGNEIYQGDILHERSYDEHEPNGYRDLYYPIVFQQGSFGYIGEITGEFFSLAVDPLENCTIVGNIYQHPELLFPADQPAKVKKTRRQGGTRQQSEALYWKPFDFKTISEGMIIRNAGFPMHSYVLTGNYGSRATAVRTVDITNPSEWQVLNPTK
jgi:hypothetical protein